MNRFVFFTTGFVLSCMVSLGAWARPSIEVLQPASVDIIPERVFVPLGFDDNDNVQVVLDGQLSDTCHKLGETIARIDEKSHRIYLRQRAFYYTGGWCADVRIPYLQTVNLGILTAGDYEVLVERPDGGAILMGSLPVAISSTANPDNFLYAPVTEVRLVRARDADAARDPDLQGTLILAGNFSSSCMRFTEVKLNIRPNNVIEVLPVAEVDRDRNCAQVQREFNTTVPLRGVPHGRYLIHVRSLNGQSINRIADF